MPGPFGIVPPNKVHAFEARGRIAHLFVEPEGRAGRALSQYLQHDGVALITAMEQWDVSSLIDNAFEHPSDQRDALREIGEVICNRIAVHSRDAEPDRRVRQMIEWANANLDGPLGMSEAASCVGLSLSRASHLFVEETGLPFRHYVLWLRLVRAVDVYAKGQSLTDAAHEAGFADSAHLSRTFKRMFGLPAASLKLF